MNYSKDLLSLLETFEGCELKAYQDVGGVLTIGYGHTGSDVFPGMTISLAQAEKLAEQDLQSAVAAVKSLVKVALTQNEFDALCDFVYNVGRENFERSTMLHLLNVGEYHLAAEEFVRWDKVNGKPVAGLLRRREAEESLFKKLA